MRISHSIIAVGFVVALTGAASAQVTTTTPPPPGATKVCATFISGVWRTATPVAGTWSLDDCRNMGQTLGANTLQVGCIFDKEQPGQTSKFILGGASSTANPPTPANVPNPNCGW